MAGEIAEASEGEYVDVEEALDEVDDEPEATSDVEEALDEVDDEPEAPDESEPK